MKNEDILKENGGKKFSICIQNPPYAQTLYLKFLEKELDIADNIISINPSALIKRDSKHFNSYKKKFDPYLKEIEELDSDAFSDTAQQSVCIMIFGQDKKELNIKYLDGKEEKIQGILEKDNSGFSDYEKEIVKYLYNEKPNIVEGTHGLNGKSIKKDIIGFANKLLSKLPDGKAYLIVSGADGSMKAKYFSSKTGQIFDNKEDLKKWIINNAKMCHYMYIDNIIAAKNIKLAMQRPLLRFSLIHTQTDQNIKPSKHYIYIPNIDWSDNRVKTDEGLLEVCGCPKDKCKEYAEYCKKIIQEVDKK